MLKIPPNHSPKVATNRVFLVTFHCQTPGINSAHLENRKEQQDQVSNTQPGDKGSSVSHRKLRRSRKVRLWDPGGTRGVLTSLGGDRSMHIPQGKTPLAVWREWARPFIGSAKHRCSAPGRPGSARARTLSTLLAAQLGAGVTPTTSGERGSRCTFNARHVPGAEAVAASGFLQKPPHPRLARASVQIPSPPRPAGPAPDDIIPAPDNRDPPLLTGPASCCFRLPPPYAEPRPRG